MYKDFDSFNCHECWVLRFIATNAPTFFGYIISVIPIVGKLEGIFRRTPHLLAVKSIFCQSSEVPFVSVLAIVINSEY